MIYRDPYTDFERFALDHQAHVHCQGCGGCLLDPAFYVQHFSQNVWCVTCRDRIKASGVPLPWHPSLEFASTVRSNDAP